MHRTTALALTLLAALAACTAHRSDPVWMRQDPERLDAEQQVQYQRALAAKNALFSGLLETLQASLKEHGHADSLGVCKHEAPRLAAEVSRDLGLRIGRTSHRLRNPRNAVPAWAAPVVQDQRVALSMAHSSDGELGVLLPIVLADTCLPCHGADDQLAPGVAAALAREYPDDRATGFAEGELRGWFWVEVPGAE